MCIRDSLAHGEEVTFDAHAPHRGGGAHGPHRAERDEGRMSRARRTYWHVPTTVVLLLTGVPGAGLVTATADPGGLHELSNS